MVSLLEVREAVKNFGGVKALRGCSLSLDEQKIYGLIGPNGSGKTTLFNAITGWIKLDSGEIKYRGESLNRLGPRQITMKGIGRTFQLVRVFPKLTVMENLIAVSRIKSDETKKLEELLDLGELIDFKDEYAKNLSFGQRKQLEVIRVLVNNPDLILLDEPMAGLAPNMVNQVIKYIRYAKQSGKTIMIVEHNLEVILNLCEKVFVLSMGMKIAEGTPEDIRKDSKVVDAYIGSA